MRLLKKELTGVVQGVYEKKSFWVRFQDGCENDLTFNKFTLVTVKTIPMEEETQGPGISQIPDKTVPLTKV